MDSIVNGINNLIDFFTSIPAWIFSLFKNLLLSLFDMLADLSAFIFDMLLTAVVEILALIPIPVTSFNADQYMVGLPAQVMGMFVAIRLPEAFGIIVIALGIRFLLGLIPLIRVGR